MSESPKPSCSNCGTPLDGPYCSQCGQPREDRIGPLRQLLADVADELFSFDTRLVRTMRMLVSRPGELTVAYLGGRRAPFLRPFRLFVVSGLLLLLLTSLGRSLTDSRGVPMLKPVINVAMSDGEIEEMQLEADSIRAAGTLTATAKAAFVESTARAAEDPKRINRIFQERLSILAAMLLPAFAGLLQLLFRRRFYTEHVIHALHLHAFLFLLVSVYLSVAYIVRSIDATQTASVLLPLAVLAMIGTLLLYGFQSLRRVYSEPFWTTAWKGGLLLLLNGFVFLSALLIYLFGTLLIA